MVLKRYFKDEGELVSFRSKLAKSVELLQRASTLSLSMSDKGYYLAFSGGKDSLALYYVAKLAKVAFESHYSLTTLDPPELVRFIKSQFPDVIIDRPEISFLNLCIKKKALPLRRMRFCCAVLKEQGGAGKVVLTGVRRQESSNRKKRNEAEIVSTCKKRRFSGNIDQFDQFSRTEEYDPIHCIKGKDKIVINPIIDWSENDVWYFLNEVVRAVHCKLYDKGWKRIGCMFCPMARKRELLRVIDVYPKYTAAFLRMIEKLRLGGYLSDYQGMTSEDILQWWVSKKPIKKWYAENKLQLHLF